ncbi:universal stress protein (plasmid) [Haloarcula salina]|uniref:universal stress protein n=1 Tax=Haloarcula salina TaxID=1429914 RepID=UPI003C6FABD7
MTLVVPFDGSELAEAALVRATEFGIVFDEDVLAVTVIPRGNADYAREREWLEPSQPFDMEGVVATVHEQVTDLCPSADFRHKVVDRYAPAGTIAKRVRNVAQQVDASMVFIGSDNAGHLVSTVSSVGQSIAVDDEYDVVIVRDRSPAKISKLRNASPHVAGKSDFYLPD